MTLFKLLVNGDSEKLIQLLNLPIYYKAIRYFAECYDIPYDLRKAIEMIEMIET